MSALELDPAVLMALDEADWRLLALAGEAPEEALALVTLEDGSLDRERSIRESVAPSF